MKKTELQLRYKQLVYTSTILACFFWILVFFLIRGFKENIELRRENWVQLQMQGVYATELDQCHNAYLEAMQESVDGEHSYGPQK